jgi:uncharacterized protein (DUF427 family)
MPQPSREPAPGFRKYPDHQVTIAPGRARVRVLAGDTTVADSTRALLVQESRHDDVYYLPAEDVAMQYLHPTDSSTYCPFKGHASYWSVGNDPALKDSVWSYQDPYQECAEITGYLAFYADRFDIQIEAAGT